MGWPTLDAIIGHRAQIDLLRGVAARGRFGHAYLFSGPDACGKRATAQAWLGRLAYTAASGDSDRCRRCRSCLALARGDHPDLFTVTASGEQIVIDQVREIVARLRFEPVAGAINGVVFDEADRLNDAAANALLKTLEEPAPRTIFVLVTSRPQRLFDTVRSRCQAVRFGDLAPADLASVLARAGVAESTAREVAALADGSCTQGLALADPSRLAILDLVIGQSLRLAEVSPAAVAAWPEQIGRAARGAGSGEGGGKGEFGRAELALCVSATRAVLRDAVHVACGVDPAGLPHARHAAGLRAIADRAGPARLAEVVATLDAFEGSLAYYPNARLAWAGWLCEAAQRLG